MPDEPDDFLTAAEVATLCRVTKTTVFRWVANKELVAVRLGQKVIRFRRADVEKFISKAAS